MRISVQVFCAALACGAALATQAGGQAPRRPWMNLSLTADARADLLLKALTKEEKLGLVRGDLGLPHPTGRDVGALGSAGHVPGVDRLGVPALQESDASLGVANPLNVRKGDGATALPSGLASAATWNPALALAGGTMIGREAHAKGFNVLLSGGVNLARDPRNGRNFEYLGEDPLLAGVMAGQAIKGVQSNHIVSTVKHFALNDQETGRMVLNAVLAEAPLRESDLLAFELAIETGHPGSVMCAYNRVNGAYACENQHLLNDVLKTDWGFAGWVMSDWGAVHSATSANQGLDQQSGAVPEGVTWFDQPLKTAIDQGQVPLSRLDDMVRRILRALFVVGVFDDPAAPGGAIDYAGDAEVAKTVALEGAVLLKNHRILPLSRNLARIVVIGGHADVGVISGGGSSQVIPVGGSALTLRPPSAEGDPMAQFRMIVYDPSSPLAAIRAAAPTAVVEYADGSDPEQAALRAKGADVAIVFATQWMIEGTDAKDLALPDHQDALITAVADANPRTVVVLETGGPVLAPWLSKSAAVLEAWYPGARGGEAIADLLFGVADPSGRLPITFPSAEADLPRPQMPGARSPVDEAFDVDYPEGADIGYRWEQRNAMTPLFPFGYGLSYTAFSYSGLQVHGGEALTVSLVVKNTGERVGMDTPQIYGAAPGEARRLIGWRKLTLRPGESRRVTVGVDLRTLARYEPGRGWRVLPGRYSVSAGASSVDLPLSGEAVMTEKRLKP